MTLRIGFVQVYIREGVEFHFSCKLQKLLRELISPLVTPGGEFLLKYGDDVSFTVYISAKRELKITEFTKPHYRKRSKEFEMTVFIPFDVVHQYARPEREAIQCILIGTIEGLRSLGLDTSMALCSIESIVEEIASDPQVFETE